MLSLHTKIRIDRIVGTPIVHGLNILSRILGFFLRRNHDFGDSLKTIVVCKLLGLGGIIQSSPLLKALKDHYPQAKIVYVTTKAGQGTCEAIPFIDEIILLDDKSPWCLLKSVFSFIRRCHALKVDAFLNLEVYSQLSNILAITSMGRNRLGYYTKPSDILNVGIYTHMAYYNTFAPRHRIFTQLALLMDISESSIEDKLPPLTLNPAAWETACAKLPVLREKNYIVLASNTSDLGAERRWSPDFFRDLARRLAKTYPDTTLLFCGTASEKKANAAILAGIDSETIINTAGVFTLAEFLAVVANTRMIVANDTGPMHIALALNVKTLALFGPTHPRQYTMKLQQNFYPIYKSVYCSPCVHIFDTAPCNGHNVCMKLITVDEVLQTAHLLLNDSEPPKKIHVETLLYGTDDDIFSSIKRS
ncbi:MAG: glycosyltransferase family 9 protein [Alphaproteobacteria bacterium]